MGYDTPFLSYVKNRYVFAEFIIELVALAVKNGWAGGDKNIFMSIFFADDLGFWSSSISKIRTGNWFCENSILS